MENKKQKTSRLEQFKMKVKQMKDEYKTDKKSLVEKLKTKAKTKKENKKTSFPNPFSFLNPKPLYDKEKSQEFINKLRQIK